MLNSEVICVVVPCFRVKHEICDVINAIPEYVDHILVVDDCCPEFSGRFVQQQIKDNRVEVFFNEVNLGVGGAVKRGYEEALAKDVTIVVKLDGDGQMDPSLIAYLIHPLVERVADYTKGNRFIYLDDLSHMPTTRLLGNAVLSFMTKFSSGYWHIFDPTNGYTAVRRESLMQLSLEKISNRYFFESDMLFRLCLQHSLVCDVPMKAKYEGENSSLRILKIIPEFLWKHFKNFGKRIFYQYYLQDFSIASVELPIGVLLFGYGATNGVLVWLRAANTLEPTPVGTLMLIATTMLIGVQFLLAFLSFDINRTQRIFFPKGQYK
jgi:glycosyltransferase involved in cell wall biosynthesis